jgi:hypothetical protein
MDSTIEEKFNSIPKDFFNLKIVHHGAVVNTIFAAGYFNDRVIKLSKDMISLQVNDAYGDGISKINKIKFENPNQVVSIRVPVYEKWLSKPRELLKYIKENYKTLPEYILYTDGSDVAILNNIDNPKEILDYYQCDVLFNCEPNYMHTGFGLPSHGYYNPLYEKEIYVYENLNVEKYGIVHKRSINAGVFLGKKDYVITMLEEAMKYMEDDHNKGFPYGCLDDQCMFRWLQNQHFDKISVDVYNNYFLFGYPKSIETDENDWEHFQYFKKKYEHIYLSKYPQLLNKEINLFDKIKNIFKS